MKRSKIMHKLAAAVTVGVIVGSAEQAHATAATFSNITDNLASATQGLPNAINMFGYIAGTGLAVTGIFKLKQHVDNPGQTPLKDGMIRLGAGGGCLTIPFISAAMQGSIGNGTGMTIDVSKMNQMSSTTVFNAP